MKTFRDALFSRVDAPGGPSLRAVAEGAGVSYEQLKKLRQRPSATTNIEDAVRVAHFFGLSIDEFMEDSLTSDRLRVVQLYNALSPQERAMLEDLARVRSAPSNPAED